MDIDSSWIFHFDVEDFFDSVSHTEILSVLTERIPDSRLIELAERMLVCGVVADGRLAPTPIGIAQGSPLSPLLANAVLDRLDQWLDAKGTIFARYADDCAVLLESHAEGERLMADVEGFLEKMSLRLNSSKTVLSPALDAAFLGFSFARGREGACRRIISAAAVGELRTAVEERLKEQAGQSCDQRIEAVAEFLSSWFGYFGATEDPRQVHQVIEEVEDLLRRSQWGELRSGNVRATWLISRGIDAGLAETMVDARMDDPALIRVLRAALPIALLPRSGIGAVRRSTGGVVQYNGRLQPPKDRRESFSHGGAPGEPWELSLIRSSWVSVVLQLGVRHGGVLPRSVSIRMDFGGHRIVIGS